MGFGQAKLLAILLWVAALSAGSLSQAAAQQPGNTELFAFHSGFWVNLHHFLYRQAELSAPQSGSHRLSLTRADSEELQHLSARERDTWNQAVAYYAQTVIRHPLLFDDQMIRTKDQLEDAENSSDLSGVSIPPGLRAALLQAAPIYRQYWWPRHDAENRAWIDKVRPLVARNGLALSAQLSHIYEEPWPQYPVRVDAVAYANWAGAYTTVGPTRPTISTTDPANQGTAALEIVFHETSHGMMDKVMEAMQAAEARVNAHRPGMAFHAGSLWHAVLFYTAGELVAKQFPGYIPYADQNGLWARAWPSPDRSLIEQDWQPHLDGVETLQESLAKLVEDRAAFPVTPAH